MDKKEFCKTKIYNKNIPNLKHICFYKQYHEFVPNQHKHETVIVTAQNPKTVTVSVVQVLKKLIVIVIMLTACGNSENEKDYNNISANAAIENSNEALNDKFTEMLPIISEKEQNSEPEGMVANPQSLKKKNTYDTLNVATYITKIDELYFIVDCYHDQVIYHDNLSDSLNQWNVLTEEVHYAHTIASDETVLLIDDTEHNRLLVFQKAEDGYMHTQTLENIGMKPHYIQYDAQRGLFMAWSSITGEMYLIRRSAQADEQGIYPLYIENILKIDTLYGVYVRSFTIIEDGIYFVSGHNNQKIVKAVINEKENKFDIVAEYVVTPEIAGMVQLAKIEDYYYITISTDNQENQDYATIIRTKELEGLEKGEYEEIYAEFGISGGTPYYITKIEGTYYMAHHRTNENIVAFDINNNMIENVAVIY